MSLQKYTREVDYLNEQTNLVYISLQANCKNSDGKSNDILEKLTTISKNLEITLHLIIRDTLVGKIDENEYDIISQSIKKTIEKAMANLRHMASVMLATGNTDTYKSLIDCLISLHISMLKYTPPYRNVLDAYCELDRSEKISNAKEKLEKAIARWEEAELTFRGSHAMLPKERYLSYFSYNRRRIEGSREYLEKAIETSKKYLVDSSYRNDVRKSFIFSSNIPNFSINTSLEDTFIRELQRLQKSLEIESKDTTAHSYIELKITIDENRGIVEAFDSPSLELKNLCERASDIFYKSFDLENHVVLAGRDAKEYVACIFANQQTIRKMRIYRELSYSPKSIDETFSVTLSQMKIYSVVNFLIGSMTVGADLKMLNILESTGNFGYDKWGIAFAVLTSILASIIGYKALKNIGNILQMIPEIYRLHTEYNDIERRL